MDLLTIFLCLQSFGSSLAQQKSSSRKRGPRSSSGRSTGGSKLLLDAASSLPIEDGYWEVQKTAHAAFDSIRDDKLYIKKADIDNTGIHSCYFYKLLSNTRLGLEEETGSFCYPAIMVTGMRKCSTSALYALLASLPGAVGNDIKENCPFVGTRSIIEYFKSLPKYVEAGEVIVDGCVDLNSNLLMKDILREPNTFYIVLTRDFSDWVWSAYNYWCSPSYEKNCNPGSRWVQAEYHIRSPELFHSIVTQSLNDSVVRTPLEFNSPCTKAKDLYRAYTARLWAKIPHNATVVLASEELDQDPQTTWTKLSLVSGVPYCHQKIGKFKTVRYNTQESKGAFSHVSKSSFQAGLYPASGHKPLLNTTRSVLDKCWQQDCLWTAKVTRYNYRACDGTVSDGAVAPLASTNTHAQLPVVGDSSINFNIDLKQVNHFKAMCELPAAKIPKPYALTHGYIRRNIRACQEEYNAGVAAPPHGIPRVTPENRRTLLLGFSLSERQFLHNLIRYASKGNLAIIDIEGPAAKYNTSISTKQMKRRPASAAVTCDNVRLVSASPHLVELVPFESTVGSDGRSVTTDFKIKVHPSAHHPGCPDIVFDRMIVISSDPLLPLWAQYRLKYAYDSLVRLNWTDWERFALQKIDSSAKKGGGSIGLTDMQMETISNMPAAKRLYFRYDEVMYGPSKAKLLGQLISFVGPVIAQKVLNDRSIYCGHVLANLEKSEGISKRLAADAFSTRNSLDQAYSSNNFLCKLFARFNRSSSSVPFASLASSKSNIVCINGSSVESAKEFAKMCSVRYSKRTFLQANEIKGRHPVALFADNSGEMINFRKIIEHATAIYTGSETTNWHLIHSFPAESVCGLRLSLIHTNPAKVTILRTKLGKTPAISLSNWGKKKCGKGMIRGFGRVIILFTDPFRSIWQSVASLQSLASSSPSSPSPSQSSSAAAPVPVGSEEWKAQILKAASAYDKKKSLFKDLYSHAEHIISIFDPKDVLMVSYESVLHPQTRTQTLQKILEFMKFSEETHSERMQCAFTFLPRREVPRIEYIASIYQSGGKEFICAVRKVLQERLGLVPFKDWLFQDLDCTRTDNTNA